MDNPWSVLDTLIRCISWVAVAFLIVGAVQQNWAEWLKFLRDSDDEAENPKDQGESV